jgi:hypothetical protein
MPNYYFNSNVVVADSLKIAKQVFEKIYNTKIDIQEILDYEPIFLTKLEKVDGGYLILLKDGSYLVNFSWNSNGFKVFSSFDKTNAKIFNKVKKAAKNVENLFCYNDNINNWKRFSSSSSSLKIIVDGIEVFPDILI